MMSCCLLLACAPGRSVLTVSVNADPPLTSVTSLNATVLDVTHTPSRTANAMFAVNGPIPPKRSFSLVLPADISGMVTLTIDAVGTTASASQMVAVRPSEVVTVAVQLGGGGGGSGGRDGGGGGSDGGSKNLGDACTTGPCSTLLDSCTVGVQDVMFTGGYCTIVCNSQQAMANCTGVGGDCEYVQGLYMCLQRCHPSAGMTCRTGYSCCTGTAVTTTSGWCAPSNSSACGF
jgi:hypothetical protein